LASQENKANENGASPGSNRRARRSPFRRLCNLRSGSAETGPAAVERFGDELGMVFMGAPLSADRHQAGYSCRLLRFTGLLLDRSRGQIDENEY
jgi:hypothetical protein